MGVEPALSRTALLGALSASYGLTLDRAQFLPAGTAPAYRVEGPSGRFFVKVVPCTGYGAALLGRLEAEVPLLRALKQHGVLERVPQVVPTRGGGAYTRLGDLVLFVYGWIDGAPLEADWTNALPELAPLLGSLHASSPAIAAAVPELPVPPEDFELPFEGAWLQDWADLENVGRRARPGVRALRGLLLPHADALARLLAAARSFGRVARAREAPFVLCHTDAHGGNVLRDAAGALWIIDWETARLAPPEHDLWMLGERLPEVLGVYERALGRAAGLEPDLLGFYVTRRALEDLAMDVHHILHENTREEEDAANLDLIERVMLPAAQRAETDVDQLCRALERRSARKR